MIQSLLVTPWLPQQDITASFSYISVHTFISHRKSPSNLTPDYDPCNQLNPDPALMGRDRKDYTICSQ